MKNNILNYDNSLEDAISWALDKETSKKQRNECEDYIKMNCGTRIKAAQEFVEGCLTENVTINRNICAAWLDWVADAWSECVACYRAAEDMNELAKKAWYIWQYSDYINYIDQTFAIMGVDAERVAEDCGIEYHRQEWVITEGISGSGNENVMLTILGRAKANQTGTRKFGRPSKGIEQVLTDKGREVGAVDILKQAIPQRGEFGYIYIDAAVKLGWLKERPSWKMYCRLFGRNCGNSRYYDRGAKGIETYIEELKHIAEG